MRILIVVDAYPPEISSASQLMQELAEGFFKKGHEVIVATSYPRYYLSSKDINKNFEDFSVENGIKIIRTKTLPHHKVNFIIRGISQILLPFLFLKNIRKFIKSPLDGVIIYSPPLPLGLMGNKIKKIYKANFILNIQDIFPQNAIDLGILKNKLLIRIFESIEKKIYKDADVITFNSEKGRKFLIEKKELFPEKVITFYNWINLEPYQNLNKSISFKREYNLEGKFVFLFAGIMGPAQGLDFVIKIARQVSDIKDIVFLLVGDGTKKEKIGKMVKEYNLSNVIIKPFVSKEDYPYLLEETDVGMVCLSTENKTSFIPGKFMGYLAAGLPIIAFLNKGSDGFSLMEKANCGYACLSGDLEKAVELVKKIYNEKEKLREFSQNAKVYASNNLSIDSCVEKFEKLLK